MLGYKAFYSYGKYKQLTPLKKLMFIEQTWELITTTTTKTHERVLGFLLSEFKRFSHSWLQSNSTAFFHSLHDSPLFAALFHLIGESYISWQNVGPQTVDPNPEGRRYREEVRVLCTGKGHENCGQMMDTWMEIIHKMAITISLPLSRPPCDVT